MAEWHEDLDFSGKTIDRPGFQRALERIEAGQTGGLVVARLDRFARSLSAALEAIRRIDEAGGVFTSVAEGIDPTSPAGKMQRSLFLVLAEFELDRITESWSVAQARAIQRGHFQAPFGYDRTDDGLVPNEHAPLVREVFHRRADGASWRELADWLNERSTTTTGAAWQPRTVTHLIRRETYMGVAFHGRHRREDAHEAIVTEAEWRRANGARGVRPARSREYLLSGLVRCAACRYSARGSTAKSKRGERVPMYACHGRHGAGKCPAPVSVYASVLEPYVESQLLERAAGEALEPVQGSDELERALARLREAEAELVEWRDDVDMRRAIGDEHYRAGLRARVESVEQARGEVESASRPGSGLGLGPQAIVEAWPQLTVPERRELIRVSIDAVVVRRLNGAPIEDRALVLWRGEAPADLPRSNGGKVAVPARPFDWPDGNPIRSRVPRS